MTALNKITIRGDLRANTFDHFFNKDPNFARFYLLRKMYKLLRNIPSRPAISNCVCYTENIWSFLYNHLQPLAKKVGPYIKDTNHFLKNLKS